ncbi:hypothetical protein SAMN02745163_03596 [Clostridium cavendishii DSM 21758]|uniref:Uncharacterized protein n=1 Tax=Clostridium cavendishii DSM 21758 TaxID=1121302 RepID=A0A1M6RBW1_9CLOT|nr:hypothetical protein [Clostridium cavendishii]SHK29828.1 hypothetical protein SAMN02745163_03596 [Clostridium cavendishii DSM 21758]
MNFEDFFNDCYASAKNNTNKNEGCNDIPGGFQDLNPELFTILGTIVGDVMAGNMPFNVQNAVGNWLELVGQIILVYNAQQQYFQAGPGRYYNINNKNINNPFCQTNSNSSSSNNNNYGDEIDKLKEIINSLVYEVEEIKKQVKNIKNY